MARLPGQTRGMGNSRSSQRSSAAVYDLATLYQQGRRARLLADANPELAKMMPEAVGYLASDPTLDEVSMMALASDIGGHADLEATMAQLKGIDNGEDQLAFFQTLSPPQQQMLQAAGYVPPSPATGGFEIPFTAGVRSITNLVGLTEGDGNFQVAGGMDSGVSGAVAGGLDAVAGAVSFLPNMARSGLDQGLRGLENLGDIPFRAFRTSQLAQGGDIGAGAGGLFMPNQQGAAIGQGLWSALKDGDLGRLWGEAAHASHTFLPDAVRQASELVGNDAERLAWVRARAGGDSIKEIMEDYGPDPGTPEYADYFQRVSGFLASEPAAQAVLTLARGRAGFGNNMARDLDLDPTSGPGMIVSASSDLMFGLMADPTLIAGKTRTMVNLARSGFRAGSLLDDVRYFRGLSQAARADNVADARRILDKALETQTLGMSKSTWMRTLIDEPAMLRTGRRVNAQLEALADAFRNGTQVELVRRQPKFAGVMQDLIQLDADWKARGGRGLSTIDDFWDAIENTEVGKRLIMSKAGGIDPRIIRAPMLTRADQLALRGKDWWNKALDWGDGVPQNIRDDFSELTSAIARGEREIDQSVLDELGTWRRRIDDVRPGWQKPVAAVLGGVRRFTTHVPRNQGSIVTSTTGRAAREGFEEFTRFSEYGRLVDMPTKEINLYQDLFLKGSEAQRELVVRRFMGDLLGRSGLLLDADSDAWKLWERYVAKSDQVHMSARVGAIGGAGDQSAAIWGRQLSGEVAIPRFDELAKAISRYQMSQNLVGRSWGTFDGFIRRVWAPAQLMRMGFIARTAGEETLSFVLRVGTGEYFKAKTLANWTTGHVLDPVTGQLRPYSELSPWSRAFVRGTEQIARWGGVSRAQLTERAYEAWAQADPQQVQRVMLANNGHILDTEEFADAVTRYRSTLGAGSRLLQNLTEGAYSGALWFSPKAWKAARATHLPSRAQIGRLAMGVDIVELEAGRRHDGTDLRILAPRLGENRWTKLRVGTAEDNLRLMTAYLESMQHPTVARAMAEGIADGFAVYGADAGRVRLANLSDMTRMSGRTSIQRNGEIRFMPMRQLNNEWEQIDFFDNEFKRRLAHTVGMIGGDPAVQRSGALQVLDRYVDDGLFDEITRFVADEDALAGFDSLRSFVHLNVDRNWLHRWIEDGAPFSEELATKIRKMAIESDDLSDLGLVALDRILLGDELPSAALRAKFFTGGDELHPLTRDWAKTQDDLLNVLEADMTKAGNMPDNAAYTRLAQERGVEIEAPPKPGQVRLYTVTFGPGEAGKVRQLWNSEYAEQIEDAFIDALIDQGMNEDTIMDAVAFLRRQLDEGWEGADGQPARAFPLLTTDHRLAQSVNLGMQQAVRSLARARAGENAAVWQATLPTVAFTDIPLADLRTKQLLTPLGEYGSDWADNWMFATREGADFYQYRAIDPDKASRYIEITDGDAKRWVSVEDFDDTRMMATGREQLIAGETEASGMRQIAELRRQELLNIFTTSGIESRPTRVLGELVGPTRAGRFVGDLNLERIPTDDLPRSIFAPKMVADEGPGLFAKIAAGWFGDVVTPMMNSVIRTPHFNYNLGRALEASDNIYLSLINGPLHEQFQGALYEMSRYSGINMGKVDDVSRSLTEHIHFTWNHVDEAAPLDDFDGMAQVIWHLKNDNDEAAFEQFQDLLSRRIAPDLEEDRVLRVASRDGSSLDEAREGLAQRDRASMLDMTKTVLADEFELMGFEAKEFGRYARSLNYAHETALDSAVLRAVDLTVPFIDDHRVRSQFQETIGSLMPFWFAEEQYLKRQVRMLRQTPEALRRAQLYMDGLRHTGIVQRDAEGNEVFVYPMSEYVQKALLTQIGWITGTPGMHVLAEPMTGRVDYILPGYGENMTGSFQFGPLVGFGLNFIADRFPEAAGAEAEILGEWRADQPWWSNFLPSSVAKTFDAVGGIVAGHSNERLASSSFRAAQALDAAGFTPDPDAPAHVKEEYLDRVTNIARVMNVMDAGLQIFSPLPNGNSVGMSNLEYTELFREYLETGVPMPEAIQRFVEDHPDATAYTVFGTEGDGGPIAYTMETMQWLDDNEPLLGVLPKAATWLMPQPAPEDEFSRRAYNEIMARELRTRRDLPQVLDELYIAKAAPAYFETLNQIDQQIFMAEEAGATDMASALREQRTVVSNAMLAQNPALAEKIRGGEGRRRREEIQREVGRLLNMPPEALPPGSEDVLELMRSFQAFQDMMKGLSGKTDRASVEARSTMRETFLLWADGYVRSHPKAKAFYDSVVMWDAAVGGYETQLATGLAEVGS